MKMGWTGLESAGKSQLMAVYAEKVLFRNERWAKRRKKLGLPHVERVMAFDTPMSQKFQDGIKKAGHRYLFFKNLDEIMPLSEMDVFINEIAKFFPQKGSDPLTMEQIEFLSQAAKDGVDIYFCAQNFSQVHKQFRTLVNSLHLVKKIIGSDRPMRSAPPVSRIWGIVLYWELDPETFKGDSVTMERETWWPAFYWINRRDTELYDTSYKVKGTRKPPQVYVPQYQVYLSSEGQIERQELKYVKR